LIGSTVSIIIYGSWDVSGSWSSAVSLTSSASEERQ
jgi:hypothetical protein